uniref:Transmembrane protein 241 n=1 Tax=Latimeria chalumnae TaxID=7897 RepID=H3BD08_LATCH
NSPTQDRSSGDPLPIRTERWQTLVGGVLLHVSWKLGWVEISSFSRSTAFSWLPGSVLFVGSIYAGSRALSRLPIPVFFTLHNAAEVAACILQRFAQKEELPFTKLLSILALLTAAGVLPLCDPQFDPGGYFWAVVHLLCVGGYKVFQKLPKSGLLSDLEQQYINYAFSVLLLASAAHPTGDLLGALEFPFLYLYRFHSSCCVSGILGFLMCVATVKLKSNIPSEQCGTWVFIAKVLAACLSPLFFDFIVNAYTVSCLLLGGLGEALLLYTEKNVAERRG